jgi:adenylate cyclase
MNRQNRSRLFEWWQQLQNVGINEHVQQSEHRYIRAVNGMVVIVTALLWMQLPLAIWLLPSTRFIVVAFLLWPLLASLVPLFNYYGKAQLARVWYSLLTMCMIVFNAVQLGSHTSNHLFMVAATVAFFIIFPPSQRKTLYSMVILAIFLFTGLEWFFQVSPPLIVFPDEYLNFTRWSSMSAFFLIVLGITAYHYAVVHDTEKKLEVEHQRSEHLLRNILPASTAIRLKNHEKPIADLIPEASVLFADLVGFTVLSSKIPHNELVVLLDSLFTQFDRIVKKYGLEKIKMIGDAYMVAGGVPDRLEHHCVLIAKCALDMREAILKHNAMSDLQLGLRIGIHVGPVVAGVICEEKFAYDLWGETVNFASRMESHGVVNEIQVSEQFYQLTKDYFDFTAREEMHIKGIGMCRNWLLSGNDKSSARNPKP